MLIKNTAIATNWHLMDSMRGLPVGGDDKFLFTNTSGIESSAGGISITATGFYPESNNLLNVFGSTYIYIAIRRGPMKVPTVGTSVFTPIARTGNGSTATVTGVGFAPDMVWIKSRPPTWQDEWGDFDRLRSTTMKLVLNTTTQETGPGVEVPAFTMDGCSLGASNSTNKSGETFINYFLRRAPSFFDEVCYTGTGSARTVAHNLTVIPELLIVKTRSAAGGWFVRSMSLPINDHLALNLTNGAINGSGLDLWNSTYPTSTVFSVNTSAGTNGSGSTYVAYLFATCPGVSKVGSYTGNGTTQTIDCGFGAGGVRFVLIKRTDAVGGWYVYDTARGMTVMTDPYLFINSTAAEVATLGSVTTVSTGFALNSAILADINVSAGSYIFLAIA